MIEFALRDSLIADPSVSALVSTRVYPLLWPDNPQFPLVTYQRISTVTDGVLSGPMSMVTVRMQFDAWAESYSSAKAVTEALNSVLEGFHGPLPDGTWVDNLVLDSSFDLYDSPSLRYRVSTDYLVTYNRS